MVWIPSESARCGVSVTFWPSKEMVPSSGWWAPDSTLISVDFPAPFSPHRQ